MGDSLSSGSRYLMEQIAPEIVTAIAKLLTDIRCTGNGSDQEITSRSDAEVRYAAAARLYAIAKGARLAPKAGRTWTVTWADNGTTTYDVIGGVGLIAGISPKGAIEKLSDGVAVDGPSCEVG
jgi:hypothetical protein